MLTINRSKSVTLAVSLLTAACMSAGALPQTSRWKKSRRSRKAEKGMKRQVIQLPQQQDESAPKVESWMTARCWKSTETIIVSAGNWKVNRKAGAMITMSLRS